jgi:hypothetical protein
MKIFEECHAILKYTTNSKFLSYINLSGYLKMLPDGCFYFDTLRYWLKSSIVKDISYEDSKMTFRTMNSVYVFEKLNEETPIFELKNLN